MRTKRTSRVTDDMFASIPALVEQGMSTREIAAQFGVTANTLKVYCSGRDISLRRGGRLPRPDTQPTPLPDAVTLTLSAHVARSLRDVAKATGRNNPARLVADLLERIATDGLYRAVLDEEVAE